jgi:hypothetical protein
LCLCVNGALQERSRSVSLARLLASTSLWRLPPACPPTLPGRASAPAASSSCPLAKKLGTKPPPARAASGRSCRGRAPCRVGESLYFFVSSRWGGEEAGGRARGSDAGRVRVGRRSVCGWAFSDGVSLVNSEERLVSPRTLKACYLWMRKTACRPKSRDSAPQPSDTCRHARCRPSSNPPASPCVHCGHCRHCGQPLAAEGGGGEAAAGVGAAENDDRPAAGATAPAKTASQECKRPHRKPPWMSPNRLPLISPGSGVYADPDENGKWLLMSNAPYGRHSRPMSDVFGGLGWSYGYGCTLGPFFGTGVGVSLFPTAPIFGAGAGCGLVCGVGATTGLTLGIGKAFIALGFNEPLTQTPRFYEFETTVEKFLVRTLHKVSPPPAPGPIPPPRLPRASLTAGSRADSTGTGGRLPMPTSPALRARPCACPISRSCARSPRGAPPVGATRCAARAVRAARRARAVRSGARFRRRARCSHCRGSRCRGAGSRATARWCGRGARAPSGRVGSSTASTGSWGVASNAAE